MTAAIATVHTTGINWESIALIWLAVITSTTTIAVNIRSLRHKLNGHLREHMGLPPQDNGGETPKHRVG